MSDKYFDELFNDNEDFASDDAYLDLSTEDFSQSEQVQKEEIVDAVVTPQDRRADFSKYEYHYNRNQINNDQNGYNPYAYQQMPPNQPQKHEKKKKNRARPSFGFVVLILILSILVSSAAGVFTATYLIKSKAEQVEVSTNGAMVINKVEIDEKTATQLSDKPTSQITDEVADSVVEITTEVMTTNNFYGQYISQGAGSGVIISTDGYIVTNNHVIEGATSVTVTLRDKTSYSAQLVGTDSVVDIALLKIDATGLTAANFGDSDKLKVGDKAVAIGNPLGQLGGTVTDGIISALDRDVVIDEETMNLLQTDTAINPGNSGGGLFDGQGALVGIVVAKSSGEQIEGLGFAVPINDVIDILDDLKEYGYVTGRVSLGVELMDLSNQLYSLYYFGTTEPGCYVYSVESNSNAASAGLQSGDRVVKVNSVEVASKSEVENILDDAQVGDTVTFEVYRDGKTLQIEFELEEFVPNGNFNNDNHNQYSDFII